MSKFHGQDDNVDFVESMESVECTFVMRNILRPKKKYVWFHSPDRPETF